MGMRFSLNLDLLSALLRLQVIRPERCYVSNQQSIYKDDQKSEIFILLFFFLPVMARRVLKFEIDFNDTTLVLHVRAV